MEVMPLNETTRRECGAQIRRLREARHWSRRELSEESGVPESTIRDIETGTTPRDGTVTKLLDALDAEVTEYGIMDRWMSDQVSALVALAQTIPRDRLPEAIGAVMAILGRAARGKDIAAPTPTIHGQVVVTGDVDGDQTNVSLQGATDS